MYIKKLKYLKKILLLISLLLISKIFFAQTFPSNGIKLNYTQVMFEYPEIKNAALYKIQITDISNSSNNKFNGFFIEQKDSTTATLINGLKFGNKYQWRYIGLNKQNKIIYQSEIYSFETLFSNYIDTNFYRYKIFKKEVNEGLIFLGGSKVAINRSGKPVWFLPIITTNKTNIVYLNMTKSGTITFIRQPKNENSNQEENGYEITIDGKILWKTPNNNKILGDTIEHYNHELTKLRNNNYLILSSKLIKTNNNINADFTQYGTIIEYDSLDNIVWSWRSNDYITDDKNPDNKSLIKGKNKDRIYDFMHINGFCVDEINNILYISSRYQSRIIKIDKKTGNVILNYGNKSSLGDVKYANGYFKNQHSPLLLPDGNIAVFNNNSSSKDDKIKSTASIIIFSQPNQSVDSSKILWEFNCKFDNLHNGISSGKGNIIYLDNSDFLVNMGYPIARIFEVTKNKKIIWDCFPEQYDIKKNKWTSCNYRAYYTKSLYPVYFTLNNSLNNDTLYHKDNKEIIFKINNEGNNNDSYIIKYFADKKEIETIKTEDILPDKNKELIISLNNFNKDNKEIRIIVSSVANKRLTRELRYIIIPTK